jgi:hypothetical protein
MRKHLLRGVSILNLTKRLVANPGFRAFLIALSQLFFVNCGDGGRKNDPDAFGEPVMFAISDVAITAEGAYDYRCALRPGITSITSILQNRSSDIEMCF